MEPGELETQEDGESTAGADAHNAADPTRTTPEDDAHKDNTAGRTATFSTRITDEEMDKLDAIKNDGESRADLLCRLLGEYTTSQGRIADLASDNEHLQKANAEIRETLETEQVLHQGKFDKHVYEIGQLRARITTLENDVKTAVVPAGGRDAMDSLGMKDVLDDVKEVCGDDETCGKMMGKMLDMKAHFASKASDQEHNAEQNRLDREQKELDRTQKEEQAEKEREEMEKDRVLKQAMAEKEQKNKIELALAKKGGFKEEFLEDVVFLGGGSPKRPGKEIERRKQQARAEADDEEEYLGPDMDEDDEDFGIPAGLPRG